jgi:hypothetical protein
MHPDSPRSRVRSELATCSAGLAEALNGFRKNFAASACLLLLSVLELVRISLSAPTSCTLRLQAINSLIKRASALHNETLLTEDH